MSLNSYLLRSTVVAALGGLLFGFDTAVIAGATHALTDVFALSPTYLGVTVSAALVGTILGAMFAGIPGDRLGRRDSLRIMAVLYMASALGCAFAWGWSSLVFFRFIGGLGIGGSSVLGPMYIAEVSPARWRGRLVGFFQFNIVSGILLAYLSNYLLGLLGLGTAEWRWKLGVSALPALLFFVMLFGIPRSPRWLVRVNRVAEAREVLRGIARQPTGAPIFGGLAGILMILAGPCSLGLTTTDPTNPSGLAVLTMFLAFGAAACAFAGKASPALVCTWIFVVVTGLCALSGLMVHPIAFLIRGGVGCIIGLCSLWALRNVHKATSAESIGAENVEAELQDIVASIDAAHGHGRESLFSWKYRMPIFLAVSIGMFNQFAGINAILYYLNDIFAKAGFSKVSGDLQAVAIGATNLVFTIVAMSVIDKFGRKTLLLIGAVGTAVCQAGVAYTFFSGRHQDILVWLLIGFIAFFAFSQGAVIWVYLAEVFPNRVRASGQSLGSLTHWLMNALISGVFPVLAARSGGAPFVFFSAMMVLQFFVVLLWYPETKGVSLEAMQKKLGIA